MAIRVKDVGKAAQKFVARAGQAGGDYKDGVQNPKRDWAAATSASGETYAAGVQAAISDNRFQKGVNKAGNDKYSRKASGVGAQRYPQGVQAAQGDYTSGVTPYLQTLSSVDLGPRYPKGDPRNNERVQRVNSALRQRKLQG